MMAKQKKSREENASLDALYAAAVQAAADTSRQPAIMVEMFKQLDAITQARRIRLHLANGIVPGIVWFALSFGAVLTVGFTFFFGTKNLPAQAMMTGILSALVFLGLLVIVSIDHPFTGPGFRRQRTASGRARRFRGMSPAPRTFRDAVFYSYFRMA